jgi:hypothetical protein
MALVMECGHTAQSDSGCVICNCSKAAEQPDLTGRKAKCCYSGASTTKYKCAKEADSSTGLGFFKHKPDQDYDEYYCGCWGWD